MKQRRMAVAVTEPPGGFKRLPFAAVADEIERHRQTERVYQQQNEAMDRIQRALVSAHPGNLVILCGMPSLTWAILPSGWQALQQVELAPQWPPVPRSVKGPVAVSPDLAEAIIRKYRS